MVRLAIGLTAWLAGTAIAVSVAWLGANVVVRNAGVGPGMPVISPSVLPSAPVSSSTVPSSTVSSSTATGPRSASGIGTSPSASPSASPTSDIHAYTLTGGIVTLNLAGNVAQLVTAVPN